MNKFYSLLFLIILSISGLTLRAQVQTIVTPKTNLFPSTGLSYLDNPEKYFTVIMSNLSATEEQVYIGITITCDFTTDGTSFNMATPTNRPPLVPLTLAGTGVPTILTRQHYDQLLGHINGTELTFSGIEWSDVLQLPEGQYKICVTPYRWSQNMSSAMPAGEPGCCTFTICYSGSAPEFTMPILGQGAGNLINSNPLENFTPASSGVRQSLNSRNFSNTSDIRNSSQYTILPLQRNLTFRWTGVISNCMTNTNFNYILKIVEVGPTQNVQDAINDNPTLATINNGSKLYYTHDTVTNRHFHLQKGHIYAARVTAVLKNTSIVHAELGNDGNSQVITFVWGQEPVDYEINSAVTTSEKNNKAEVLSKIRFPYIVNPSKDQTSIDNLVAKFPSEQASVPKSIHDSLPLVENTYYLFKKDSVLPISWMPVRSDSVTAVTYSAELFEYVGGDVALSYQKKPIKSKTFLTAQKSDFAMTNTTPMTLDTLGWATSLEEGYKYVLRLTAATDYKYLRTITTTTTEYINGIPVNKSKDSLIGMVSSEFFYSNIVFQWGIDSGALLKIKPAQFIYPVDLSDQDIETFTNEDIPEIVKESDFKFAWKSPKNISIKDSVSYDLFICKLPKGKTVAKAVKDTFLFYHDILTTEYINDIIMDSLKVGNQYVVYLETHIKTNADKYNLLNKGRSLYAVFKLIDEPDYEADLDTKFACFPSQVEDLSKTVITPKVDSLVSNKVRLMMGKFPLVIQKAKLDPTKKTYTGEGYIVWSPFHGEVWLKVSLDSIQINKNFEIIKGSAKSAVQDSANYVSLDFGKGLCDFTDQALNKLESEFATNKEVKEYYNIANSYAKPLNGLCGIFENGSISTGVLTFPLSVDDDAISGTKNMKLSINNMYFSPNTALMNLIAIFYGSEDNMYIPLIATNICLNPSDFLGSAADSVSLFMAKSYEYELNDGYAIRYKASTKLGDPKDGTYLVITDGGFKQFTMEVELDMNDDLLGIDKATGTAQKGKIVHASFSATIRDWDDWYTKIYMDPFVVDGCEDYTFVPTGKGIFYDHSSSQTPKEIKFPKGYISKAEQNQWQGFYMDEFKVFLSDDISNTFTDEGTEDSVVMYKYGFNNSIVDSAHYSFPGTRINFGANDLIIDKDGFSVEIFAHDLFSASTGKAGGWSFSIDTISVRFEKNEYKYGRIAGGFGIPLFDGDLVYSCSVGSDSLDFSVVAKNSTLTLDLFLANIKLTDSYFKLRKIYDEPDTKIDLTLNGTINIDFNAIDLPVNFSLASFQYMGLRNYNLSGKADSNVVHLTDLDFDIGVWSWASPQKTIGGASSNAEGEVISGDIGGFKYSVTTLKPFFEPDKGGYMKVGLAFAGKLGFGNESFSIGAGAGFKIWSFVHMKTYDVKGFDGELDSIYISTDMQVFHLNGILRFYNDDPDYGDGIGGGIKVTIMDKVTVAMAAGFGTSKDTDGEYEWWFLEGAANFKPGVPLGVLNMTGLGGGFAYNMDSKTSLVDFKTSNLLAPDKSNPNNGASFAGKMVSSTGMNFIPKRESWVAKAGVSLAMVNESIMNADGLLTLRVANGHFSGIFMVVNAYVITSYDKAEPAGEGENNSGELLQATAIIGYEQTADYHYFRLSLCVKAEYSLANLIDAAIGNVPVFKDKITDVVHYCGEKISEDLAFNNSLDSLMDSSSNTEKPDKGVMSFGLSASLRVPIDFELKYYKRKTNGKKAGSTDWYFSVGKPNADECVRFDMEKNLVIFESKLSFTFYLIAGNSFAYALPDLDPEVEEFFFGKQEGKKLTTDEDAITKARTMRKNESIQIDNAGGFALGATFKASVEFSFFLYVKIMAAMGFDVAMLDVNGQGCEGYPKIGKNDFYAMGRVYAMLKGSVGLRLNLGFWKGDIELLSCGVGALLEGGGPQPTWAYGLLRFRFRCLGGLIKINTSVDFSVGDVCVPGAGDPLANVKLFQNITPGLETEAIAKKAENIVSPLSVGTIVSNMPWNEDVVLCDGKTSKASARKFRFVMWKDNKIETLQNNTWTPIHRLNFERSSRDECTINFETEEGGFPIQSLSRITLHARAFEWRECNKDINSNVLKYNPKHPIDRCYNLDAQTSTTGSGFGWYDPIYAISKKTYEARYFKVDTTLWFQTKGLPTNLDDQVVYTWPYNGDPKFPAEEFMYCNHGTSYNNAVIPIFLYKDRKDLFGRQDNGKQIKIYVMEQDGEDLQKATECKIWSYQTYSGMPLLLLEMPNAMKFGGDRLWKIKILSVDQNRYQSTLDSMINAQQSVTKASYELQQTKWAQMANDYLGNPHTQTSGKTSSGKSNTSNGKSGTGNTTGGGHSAKPTLGRTHSSATLARGTTSRTGVSSKTMSPTSSFVPVSGNVQTSSQTVSGRGSAPYSGRQGRYNALTNIDLSQAQYQQMLDDATAQGEDTAMLYKRISINEYAIANSIGSEVYAIRFRTTYEKTYKELFEQFKKENIRLNLSEKYSQYYTIMADYIKSEIPNAAYNSHLSSWKHLFLPYSPTDIKAYKSGITLPPIAYFVIDGNASVLTYRNELINRHKLLNDNFTDMSNHLRNEVSLMAVDRFEDHPEEMTLVKQVLAGGLTRNASSTFLSPDYRKKDQYYDTQSSYYSSYDPATFSPQTSMWSLPNILCVESDMDIERITERYFDHYGYFNQYVNVGEWHLNDYATPATVDDISKYFKFFQDCQGYAAYFTGRGHSHEVDYIEFYSKQRNVYKKLSFEDFPFEIPTIYLPTEYFNLSKWLHTQIKYYDMPDGKKDFTFTNNIPLPSARGWLNYWFRFKGIPNSLSHFSSGAYAELNENYYYEDKWKFLQGDWYNRIYLYKDYKSTDKDVKTEAAVDIYYFSGTGKKAPVYNGTPDVMAQMAAIAKKAKNNNVDALIFETNAFIDCNFKYTYWLSEKYLNPLSKTNRMNLLKMNGDKYGIDK